jgi:hypothetical protein
MSATEPIADAEVVEEAPAPQAEQALVVAPRAGSTELIQAASPAEQIQLATAMAKELDNIIRAQGMRTKMGRRKVVKPDGKEVWEDSYHTNVEAWQTLATFLGLAIVPDDPEPIRDDKGNVKLVAYEVVKEFYPKGTTGAQVRNGIAQPERVERATIEGAEGFTCRCLVYKNGIVVGAGSSRCTRLEESWRAKPDYALEGMAQTRAIGRGMATPGRWIVTLAGYNGTPAEEMPSQAEEEPHGQGPPYGPEVLNEQLVIARKAMGYLLSVDPSSDEVTEACRWLAKDAGGYLPSVVIRGITHVAKRVKDQSEGPASDDPIAEEFARPAGGSDER